MGEVSRRGHGIGWKEVGEESDVILFNVILIQTVITLS